MKTKRELECLQHIRDMADELRYLKTVDSALYVQYLMLNKVMTELYDDDIENKHKDAFNSGYLLNKSQRRSIAEEIRYLKNQMKLENRILNTIRNDASNKQ